MLNEQQPSEVTQVSALIKQPADPVNGKMKGNYAEESHTMSNGCISLLSSGVLAKNMIAIITFVVDFTLGLRASSMHSLHDGVL
jgi:hypothetical protein